MTRRRTSPFALSSLLLIALCAFPFAAAAQTATATLSGAVVDQNGAAVPGVAVTVINTATSLERNTTSNDAGNFTIPLLPPGNYTLTAKRDGFKIIRSENIVLNVNDERSLRIQMKVGDVSETVNVTGEEPLINESPAVGTIVDRQFVANIPLNGRSFQSLITLTPGVVTVPSNTNQSGQFSVNGQRSSANSFMVDGVSANFGAQPLAFGQTSASGNLPGLTTFGTTQSLTSVDALQEFKVQTSTYAAEYGRQPGGQVSIITRSGTNQFHGSIFDYLRNDVFDANDWFANRAGQAKPPERQNDFGATFSGPVLLPRFGEGGHQPGYHGRNRTFFFFSYEGLRLRLPQFNLTNVPTLALRQQAPAGMQPILNGFPLPNGKDLGNGLAEFRASYSDPSSLDATSIRIDHSINSRLTLFGRYNKAPSQSTARQQDINLSRLQISRLDTQTLTVGATASLTSRISNELRVNYSDAGAFSALPMDNFGGATPPPLTALVPSQYGSGAPTGSVTLNLPGRTSLSLPSVSINPSRAANQRQFNIVNNLSYSAGSHQFKFGFDWRRLTPTIAINTYLLTTTFSSLQQIQNAIAPSGTILASAAMKPLFVNISAYGQDTWRVSQRLTLDLGVRWDVNPAPSEANGKVPVAVTEIDNLATMQLASLGTKEWKTGYENFAPRLGFAYQLFRTPGRETVLRGGFGVFHDTGNDVALDNFNQKFPYASSRSVSNVVYPLSATQVAPGALPIQAGLTTPYPTFFAFDPNLKLPYTLQWNIAIEQSLGKSQAITASYVGAAGRNLLQSKQLTLTTINPKFTTITLTTNSATSDYDALQVQFQRRLSRGLQALASYTWSHALDDDSSGSTARVAQHGNAAFDVRQVFAAAATYDVPSPHNNRFARVVLGSWSLDTSVHAQSALPVDLVARTQTDPITGGLVNVRPNVNPGVPFYVSDPTVPGGRKINSAAFSVPATGQSGNFGRNQLRGFGGWQFDSALRRRFKLTERLSLQFRAEAFNLFNHPNFGTIQTSLTATNFGQATNMLNRQLGGISQLYQIGGPRSFQFAMKLLF